LVVSYWLLVISSWLSEIIAGKEADAGISKIGCVAARTPVCFGSLRGEHGVSWPGSLQFDRSNPASGSLKTEN
jgi:hypothetical protein